MKKYHINIFILLSVFFSFLACNEFKDEMPEIAEESVKDISGKWQVVKASRNGADITTSMDFTQFRLVFNEDNSFAIENYLPFLVKKGGKWAVDNPQYPFLLIFEESGSSDKVVSNLNFPITNGKRQIALTFTPGCYSNTYTYVFEKVTN